VRPALLRAFVVLACALAAGACTTLAPLTPAALANDDCTQWFARLDAVVDATGVRDAQDEIVPGFAFVRVDRLAVATRGTMPLPQWLARAATLDEQARDAETTNLPASAFPIDGAADAAAARARSNTCRTALMQRVLQDSALHRTLRERAHVPDRYALSLRALGAYPLMRWPFFAGVTAWQNKQTAAVAKWTNRPPPRIRFEPPAEDPFAPVFEIESRDGNTLAPFDRFGAPTWATREATAPSLDTTRPVVYRRSSHTLVGDRWLRQQVYTVWFTERPASGAFDLLSGTLDGVIVRLTLAPDGTPLMVDTIHSCGCWHQFFPAPGVALRDGAPQQIEWAFVRATLPPHEPGQRLVVRLATATHHVMSITSATSLAGERYALRNENELRTLPLPGGGGSRSLYAADGLVRGTERAERFLFWPMGIASAGAMRQWGHHATAFVGRRHFDDPNLLDSRFLLPALPPP
jgi:hypothetical protein